MATQWQHISEMWRGTCEEVLGRRKTQHKEWISADTLKKLHVDVRKEKKEALNNSRTRAAKAKALEDYTAIDKEFKKKESGKINVIILTIYPNTLKKQKDRET